MTTRDYLPMQPFGVTRAQSAVTHIRLSCYVSCRLYQLCCHEDVVACSTSRLLVR